MKMSKETMLSMEINIAHLIPTSPGLQPSELNITLESKNVKLARFIRCILELFWSNQQQNAAI